MTPRRLALAIALQALSPAVLLGLSVLISRQLGAAELGAFVSTKALLDLLVAAGCFGFPQSVVLAVNRGGASRWRLYTDAGAYAAALLPLFVLAAAALHTGPVAALLPALALAFGAAGFVLSGIWRGILLTVDDGLRFHLITVLPALALAGGVGSVVMMVPAPLAHSMAGACAIAGLLVLLGSVALFGPREARTLGGARPDYRGLATNGADVFVQALTATLQTWACYAWLRQVAGADDVGRFSVVLMAFQLGLLPLQMVAPMVLNRWSRRPEAQALSAGQGGQARIAIGLAAAVLAGCALAPWVVPAVFGAAFAPAVPAVQVLLLAVCPAFGARIGAIRLAAVNHFRANSIAALVRLAVGLGALWPLARLLPGASVLLVAALCWLLGETAALAATARALKAAAQPGALGGAA